MAKQTKTDSHPALLRITSRAKPINQLLAAAIANGLPIQRQEDTAGNIEDASAIDPALLIETTGKQPPSPAPGTGYAGLTAAQRHAFITWSRTPATPAPTAYQQLYLANIEVRLLEEDYRQTALEKIDELLAATAWANNRWLQRANLLASWLLRDGDRLAHWPSTQSLAPELLGIALGQQALIGRPLTAAQLGTTIATWQLGAHLPADLLKLRLDSLTAILGQPPLSYALSQLEANALTPQPWRASHRGLRLLIPQPDLRHVLESSLRELLAVADVSDDDKAPVGVLAALDTSQPDTPAEEVDKGTLDDLGWRLILEFGSTRSDYFDYVVTQAQKLAGYSQLMDEDRRIVYRIIFRKSEMRRFWRLWDYVHGWTTSRVYLNGTELEKWKVWPYSQHLK